LVQASAGVAQIPARALAPLQPVPLCCDRALDVGQERRGVPLRALDDVTRPGGRRRFRLAGLGQAGSRLLLAPLDGDRALSFAAGRSEEHTSELQSRFDLVCRLLLEKKKKTKISTDSLLYS